MHGVVRLRTAGLECLETRTLLAGNVMARSLAGQAVVLGDGNSNQVEITAGANPGEIILTGLSGTTINGAASATLTRVRNGLVAVLGGGDDELYVSGLDLRGSLNVVAGSGNDTIQIESSTLGGLNVVAGNGTNQVHLADLVIRGGLNVVTGGGSDTVTVDTLTARRFNLNTGSGGDQVHLANISADYLFATLGSGDDMLEVSGAFSVRRGVLDGGDGQDTFLDSGSTGLGSARKTRFEIL